MLSRAPIGAYTRRETAARGATMLVTTYLERARECADIAERLQGEDRRKLLAIANAWRELAEEAAKVAAAPKEVKGHL
jgi:hypothetical protein